MSTIDYWSPGSKYFISITSTHSKPIGSVTSTICKIVLSWDEAFSEAKKFLQNNRFCADKITIFSKPRLCSECMKHATRPLIFDKTEYDCECLCKLDSCPCGVHDK